MSETVFKVSVVALHNKELPAQTAEILASRLYGWLYSQGIEVGVNVEQVEPEKADAQSSQG